MTRPRQTPARPRKGPASCASLVSRCGLKQETEPEENSSLFELLSRPSSEKATLSPAIFVQADEMQVSPRPLRSVPLPPDLFPSTTGTAIEASPLHCCSQLSPFKRLVFEDGARAPMSPVSPPHYQIIASPVEVETPPMCTEHGFLFPSSSAETSFWAYCYGHDKTATATDESWSAHRSPPAKSCISMSKKRNRQTAFELIQNKSESFDSSTVSLESDDQTVVAATPKSSPENSNCTLSRTPRRVKFAPSSAVEFRGEEPPHQLTPLPASQAAMRFPSASPVPDDTLDNSITLAEWEDSGLFQNDDDDDEEYDLNDEPRNKERRTSKVFTPLGKSLLLDGDDDEDDILDEEDMEASHSAPEWPDLEELKVQSPINCP